jgi:8-oxo-dGTP pyrophosphatase MutT (NUDIX family)
VLPHVPDGYIYEVYRPKKTADILNPGAEVIHDRSPGDLLSDVPLHEELDWVEDLLAGQGHALGPEVETDPRLWDEERRRRLVNRVSGSLVTADRYEGEWLINGKPYSDGVWIEVEPDTWYRGADTQKGEIPSRLVVKRDGDKWAWQAEVSTFIGAPHEDTGWQKPGAPKGTAKTLEDAKARAEKSLAKDHEFMRKYDEKMKERLKNVSGLLSRILFHATDVASAEKIKQEGIRVSTETGPHRDPVNFAWFAESRDRALGYLRHWADYDETKVEGAIVSVRFPPGVNPVVGDWKSREDMGFDRDIPAEWVMGVEVVKPRTTSLLKTADEEQCPYDASDSLYDPEVPGGYICDNGHHWHPDEPAAKIFHEGPGVIQPIPEPSYNYDLPTFAPGHRDSWGLDLIVGKAKEEAPTVSGVALKAADTGRILMLQRGLEDDSDPAAGKWEFPGGHHEDGDLTSLHAGIREWEEEVGVSFPMEGVVATTWTSPDGVYQGHVVVIPEERKLILTDGRDVDNPDDPDGDASEQVAWWDPDDATKNPALREECKKTPWNQIKTARKEG